MAYEELKAEFDDYGFVVLPDLLPKPDAARVEKRVTEVLRRQPDAAKPDQHLRGLFNHLEPEDYPLFAHLVNHPAALEFARHLLGEGFQMAEVGARWRKPGALAGPVHATAPLGRFPRAGLPVPNVSFVLPFYWVLSDLTRDMGATWYLPCSHHAPHLPRPEVVYRYLVPVEAPAGSLVIHHGALWHCLGPNTTQDKARVGVLSGYIPAWLDPACAGWQLMRRSVCDQLPQEIQHMNRRLTDA